MDKVFGIGFHKTGTSTLGLALSELGYKVCGVRLDLAKELLEDNFNPVWEVIDRFDAFQDNPWPLLFKELDKRYPNSKFIFTYRNEDRWMKSLVNHFGKEDSDMRYWIYGVGHPEGNEPIYLNKYQDHYKEVLDYFKDKKEKLLVVSWKQDSDWTEICSFLEKPIPTKPFPHANKGAYNKSEKLVRVFEGFLKSIYRLIFINTKIKK